MPSECCSAAPVARGPSGPASTRRAVHRGVGLEPRRARCRTGAAGRSASSGRAGARCRPWAPRPSTSAAGDARASAAWRSGAAKVAVSHDDAGHQVRRDGAIGGVERDAQAAGSSSATISQVAAACGSIQSTAPSASLDAWWSMTTCGRRANSSACAAARHDPTRSEVAAVADDEQVVVDRPGRGRSGTARSGHEVVHRRDGVRCTTTVARRAQRLDERARRRARHRACPHRGSRG